jgi:Domain of unknown function (DUF4126)
MISGLPWGLALASGVNTYLPLFILALFGRFSGLVHLSPRFQWLVSDQALVILGGLALVEVLAQKFPGLDHFWDLLHTFIRPLAGAIAAGATLTTGPVFEMVLAMLLGGALATASHSAKTGLRLASSAKTLGAANPLFSLGEDFGVVGITLFSIYHPHLALAVGALVIALAALVGPPLVRTLAFEIHVLASWLKWLMKRAARRPAPGELRESLFAVSPRRLRALAARADAEQPIGLLPAWRKSRRGPRRVFLLIYPQRLALIEPRRFRRAKMESIPAELLIFVSRRSAGLCERLDILAQDSKNYQFLLGKTQKAFAALWVERCSGAQLQNATSLPAPSASAASSTSRAATASWTATPTDL